MVGLVTRGRARAVETPLHMTAGQWGWTGALEGRGRVRSVEKWQGGSMVATDSLIQVECMLWKVVRMVGTAVNIMEIDGEVECDTEVG